MHAHLLKIKDIKKCFVSVEHQKFNLNFHSSSEQDYLIVYYFPVALSSDGLAGRETPWWAAQKTCVSANFNFHPRFSMCCPWNEPLWGKSSAYTTMGTPSRSRYVPVFSFALSFNLHFLISINPRLRADQLTVFKTSVPLHRAHDLENAAING